MTATANRTRWLRCAAVSLSALLLVRHSLALPSQRCETVELVDQAGISRQLGLPKLVELLKTVALTNVPNGVPADIRLEFSFSPSGRITAAIRSWAEKEGVELESERLRWLEDFQVGRRTIQPMPEADAQAFRQQIVDELRKHAEARTAAVGLASVPEGLSVVITAPESSLAPLNRNRTVALLGCLRDGAELEGYVVWPDGHREPFKRRANQTPGRFVVGSPASTEPPPLPVSPLSTDAGAVDAAAEPTSAPKRPTSSTSWYWWLGAPLIVIFALIARARIKNR